jgi:SAM-dependent methyltransferase
MVPAGLVCRSCRSTNTYLVLDLGIQPLANNLLGEEDLNRPEPRFPLRLAVCAGCWLLQIIENVPPVTLFSEYLYFSSFSDTMLSHASEIAARCVREGSLSERSLVVEVASNDGYLLKNYVAWGIRSLGIEPAKNVAAVARDKGIPTIEAFFGTEVAVRIVAEHGPADVIHANNVFAHVPDIHDFVAGLKTLLAPAGSAVIEFPYGVEMIENLEFDTIYHEHVFYFTVSALLPLFESHGLEITTCERLRIHGGSLRLFVRHQSARARADEVVDLLDDERRRGVTTLAFYESFAVRVAELKRNLLALLSRLKDDGKSLAAYGASAKGSTLLNFYGLGRGDISFVADRSTYKQGRFTPGTHLPIRPPAKLIDERPDYVLLLTWNFAEEILQQQSSYRAGGGHFILPVPVVRVVS